MKYNVQLNRKRKDARGVLRYTFDVFSETDLTVSQMKTDVRSRLDIPEGVVTSDEKVLINDSEKSDDYVIRLLDKVKYLITVD